MPRQLAFQLPVRAALGRGDFFISPANQHALTLIDAPGWPEGKLLLIGPEGAGKSHLAAIWATGTGAATRAARDLGRADLPGLAAGPGLVVEDADRIAGDRAAETALFHLHNLMAAAGRRLLITARGEARGWGLTLPDLQSRMEGTLAARLDPPDDALLSALIVKLFADRQLQVGPALIGYLLSRVERSFAAVRALVTALDARGLALGRPVTRALAAELFDSGWTAPAAGRNDLS